MRILVTNDDGVGSPGIHALAAALVRDGHEVFVVAPTDDRSGSGAAVGKLYNVAARRIAARLHEQFGGYAEVHLVSATGQALAQPWQVLVRMAAVVPEDVVRGVADEVLSDFPALTREILYGDLRLA